MDGRIPDHHPLRKLFGTLAEKAFTDKLGWPDFNVSDYISQLLVEFTHTDNLYRIKSAKGERGEAVVDLLYESEVTHEAMSFEREREVHRHIGDFTLFMAGLFPEYLKRIKTAGLIYHKDFLVDYIKTGKRSYRLVAEYIQGSPVSAKEEPAPPLFLKLSENFELCVVGLGYIRGDLDRMQNSRYRQARRLDRLLDLRQHVAGADVPQVAAAASFRAVGVPGRQLLEPFTLFEPRVHFVRPLAHRQEFAAGPQGDQDLADTDFQREQKAVLVLPIETEDLLVGHQQGGPDLLVDEAQGRQMVLDERQLFGVVLVGRLAEPAQADDRVLHLFIRDLDPAPLGDLHLELALDHPVQAHVIDLAEALSQLGPVVPSAGLRLHVADFLLQLGQGDDFGIDHGHDPVLEAGAPDRQSAEQAGPQGQDRESLLRSRRWHASVERRYGVAAAGPVTGISEAAIGTSATRSLALARSDATNSS